MDFCPKCNYSLDLKKYTLKTGTSVPDLKIKKSKLKSISTVIKKIVKENIHHQYIIPLFSKDELLSNKSFNKLSEDDKNKVLKIFEQHGGAVPTAIFSCNNCNWSKQINQTIKLYNFTKQENIVKIKPSEYLMIFKNPIYSRTKDYNCKNKECKTHKDIKLKEAVFYHTHNSLEVNYVCGQCLNT